MRPVQVFNSATLDPLLHKASERIRTSAACNFPLPYSPLQQEHGRRAYLIAGDPARSGQHTEGCRAWLQEIIDAPEPDLARMVQRGQHTIEKPGAVAAQASALNAMMASHRQAANVSLPDFMAALARRGVTLAAGKAGTVTAHPARLLTDADRAVLREMKVEIAAALAADVEVF